MDFGDFNVYHIFTMGFAGAEDNLNTVSGKLKISWNT